METIQDSITQLQKMFIQRMDVYQGELKVITPSWNIANLTSEFPSFRQFIMTVLQNLQDQVSLLAQQTDNLEMQSRRKILLIPGIPEDKNDDTVAVVMQVVVDRLKIISFSTNDISRCHRMGRTSNSYKPRPILFKLHQSDLKNKVGLAKKNLKGIGITLSEFLTENRHDACTCDGSVYIMGSNGVRHRISSIAEVDKIDVPMMSKTAAGAREPAGPPRSRRVGNTSKK